jgi:hypothetical protein
VKPGQSQAPASEKQALSGKRAMHAAGVVTAKHKQSQERSYQCYRNLTDLDQHANVLFLLMGRSVNLKRWVCRGRTFGGWRQFDAK